MISYGQAPIPIWPLRDLTGYPLANGYMKAFRDTNRSEEKPVYQDSGGTLPYLQPIVFNAAGFEGPFYWADDENYYLEIYDSNNQLVKTVPAYNGNGGGSGPVTNEIDYTNYIYDSQFRYVATSFPTLSTFEQVGASNWFFYKTNTTATDSLNLVAFPLGSTNPPFNPPAYMRFSCVVAGSGETYKQLGFHFQSVYSFQNTEITFSFWARCPSGNNTLEVSYAQRFGTGGTPSAIVENPIGSVSLTAAWERYSITAVIASVTGKTFGTNADDDFLILFDYPRNSITTIDITNVQQNLGNKLLPFEYLTPTNNATLQIPFFNSEKHRFVSPSIDTFGTLAWRNAIEYYGFSSIPQATLGTTAIQIGWVPINGPYASWLNGASNLVNQHPCVITLFVFIIFEGVAAPTSATEVITFEVRLNGSTIAAENTKYPTNTQPIAYSHLTVPIILLTPGETIQLYASSTVAGSKISSPYATFIISK